MPRRSPGLRAWIAAYLVADAAMGIGIFRWFYVAGNGLPFVSATGSTPRPSWWGV